MVTPRVLRAGIGGLDPVVVRVSARPASAEGSRATVRTAAEEGLVKRHAARKAAERIGEALSSAVWPG